MGSLLLYDFLQDGLAIIKELFVLKIVQNEFQNKLLCASKTTVQIDSSKQSLCCIGNNRVTVSSTSHVLTFSKEQILRQSKISCTISKTGFANQAGSLLGQFALWNLGELLIEKITADQLQNCISKKLQTLVAACLTKLLLVCIGTMCQCKDQKVPVPELITDPVLQCF